jgi:hypothetical protein
MIMPDAAAVLAVTANRLYETQSAGLRYALFTLDWRKPLSDNTSHRLSPSGERNHGE